MVRTFCVIGSVVALREVLGYRQAKAATSPVTRNSLPLKLSVVWPKLPRRDSNPRPGD
jgi:hypothetical protein